MEKPHYTVHTLLPEPTMAAILPILIFVIAIIGLNLFEFGRAD